jgi:hypothetical protein
LKKGGRGDLSGEVKGENARSNLMCCCFVLRPAALGDGAKQIRFLYKLVEQTFPLDQLGWGIEFGNLSVIENYDAIGIEDGVDAMSNRDDSSVLEHVAA